MHSHCVDHDKVPSKEKAFKLVHLKYPLLKCSNVLSKPHQYTYPVMTATILKSIITKYM